MLQRQLLGRSAKVGVGANRAATAAYFFERYGYRDPTKRSHLDVDKIGGVILDDGMQVLVFLFSIPSPFLLFSSYLENKNVIASFPLAECFFNLLTGQVYSLLPCLP